MEFIATLNELAAVTGEGSKFENTVKNNPQLFPLLSQYAFAE